jgi:ribosome-binding protein aMBF1 (putative translation factor)
MICPICGRKDVTLQAAVVKGVYLTERCDSCLVHQKPNEYAAKWVRDRQREDHRRDMLQRYDFGDKNEIDHDWAKAYPEQAEHHFGRDKLEDSRI